MILGSEPRVTGLRWQILPTLEQSGTDPSRLFDRAGLRLAEWLAGGQAQVVKQGPHRAVFRVQLPGLDFFVKCCRGPGKAARVRKLVRASAARRECEQALAVAARGVATVEPLAFGETASGASCLLLRTLPNVEPLGSFLEWTLPNLAPARCGAVRRRLSVALGRFLAHLHDAGIAHADLHPGNLLFRLDGDEPCFYLADVVSVRLGAPLNWPQSRGNLVVLNRWFMLRASRSDRLRFWHAYRRFRQTPGWADACLSVTPAAGHRLAGRLDPLTCLAVRDLEGRALASNLRFWQAQDRRCLENGRYYRRVSSAVAMGNVVADLDAATVARFLEDPDAALQQPSAIVLKDSRSSTVVELEVAVNGAPRRVIYKRFPVTAWTDPFVALVRRTPAQRSYVLGHGLRLRALPTPRPLGIWHRYRGGLPHEGYLLTEKVPQALDLAAFVGALGSLPERERCGILRRTVDDVARLIGRLHERRISHRDLKAANILMSPAYWSLALAEQERRQGARPVSSTGPDGKPNLGVMHPWFIDLVGVSRCRTVKRARRLQNLARLNASFREHPGLTRTDRLRFLRVYLKWGLHGRFGWKRWWRQIEEATRTKVERNRRNRRPLG